MVKPTNADLRPRPGRGPGAPAARPAPTARYLAFPDELGQGIAEAVGQVVPLPRSLHGSAANVLGAGLAAALRALPLPQLPDTDRMPASLDGGGVLDAVAGLLPSREAAIDAGRRIGALIKGLLEPTLLAAATPGVGAIFGAAASGGGAGGDPDDEGPANLPQAIEALIEQQARLARLFGVPPVAAINAAVERQRWLKQLTVAYAVEAGTLAAMSRGLILPSSMVIGNRVHRFLEEFYRFLWGPVGRPPFVRGVPSILRASEIVQERRVYRPGLPYQQLSRLSQLSATWQRGAPLSARSWNPARPLRYDALWVGLWSRNTSVGSLRPDTLDFTRGLLWEIKPAHRAPEAVAQIYQYVNGYNLAYATMSKQRLIVLPDPDEPHRIAPGEAYAWPSGVPIPAVVAPPDLLAVPFTLDGLAGVVSYVVVRAKTLLEAMRRVYRELRDLVEAALRRLREWLRQAAELGGELLDEAGRKIRDWVREFEKDLRDWRPTPGGRQPVPQPVMALTMLELILILIILGAVLAAAGLLGGPPGAAAAALLLILLFAPAVDDTVPVLTPEGGIDPLAALPSSSGAAEEAPTTGLDTPLGPVPVPADLVAPLLAAITEAAGRVAGPTATAMAEATANAYANYGPLGPPHRQEGEPNA
ncbi:hypothetical protein [Streptomyces sp. ATCC 21386]|uniref:hypothetical protein n=1 Tax=Streptomyces sp. ATCC 21386 TaxID=2699428 RepID=UPI001BFEF113|nr:hypothetical protein [Streptomyces sp. ATCC 21386]